MKRNYRKVSKISVKKKKRNKKRRNQDTGYHKLHKNMLKGMGINNQIR